MASCSDGQVCLRQLGGRGLLWPCLYIVQVGGIMQMMDRCALDSLGEGSALPICVSLERPFGNVLKLWDTWFEENCKVYFLGIYILKI